MGRLQKLGAVGSVRRLKMAIVWIFFSCPSGLWSHYSFVLLIEKSALVFWFSTDNYSYRLQVIPQICSNEMPSIYQKYNGKFLPSSSEVLKSF